MAADRAVLGLSPSAGAAHATRQRLFIAVPCPLSPPIAAVLDELRLAQLAPRSGLRCVGPATLHVTLKFLGSTALDETQSVMDAMNLALSNAPALTVELKGAGSFHGALWLGVAANPALADLAQRCDAAMASIGFVPEPRTFRPHVTVARLKSNPAFDCKAWTRQHGSTSWAAFRADSVHLYRSETQPGGAHYTVIHSVALR